MNLWEQYKQLPGLYRAGSLFILLALAAMLAAWYDRTPLRPSAEFIPAPPISSVADLLKVEVKTATGNVKVLPKAKVAARIKLPESIVSNPAREISATATTPPTEYGTEVISVLDTATGETRLESKEVEPPLFGFENKRRIGAGYGVGTRGTEMKVFGEWTFLRVGGFHVGAQAEINSGSARQPEAKATAVVDYRF